VIALLAWGNRNFTPDGRAVTLVNRETGLEADPILVDAVSGRPMSDPIFKLARNPARAESARRS
jgi:hypothetical protein